jgi:superfamily II DNA or RNA helicase
MRYAPGQFEAFEDAPHYGSAEFPPPRPFQTTAHEKLRQGVRDGHKCQMLMSPTGSGKSYLGMRVAHEALAKGRRATFVCDRTTLINQTSDVAFSYGLSAHGVIQSNHPLYNPSLPFQIASVQTLARRDWPKTDVIIIDEAHTMYAAWVEHIKTCTAKVIGLSATPFSTGLGKLFTNLVNAATMHELTQQGILVPMRVFSCTTADMTGAETANGEWTDKAAAERGRAIIGDVVSEWVKFGEGRKTIVFGPTIAYCAELCQQFNDAGIMAATFTGETPDHERKALLEEYRKPDSRIRVLISVEALAKGFDVKDVSCVVDCRPLRKSLSTAIQMWGRGLRCSPETGKTDCLLLDHSGNIIRFREDFEDIYFNGLSELDMGEKLDKVVRKDDEDKEPKGCPSCGTKPFFKHCVVCGFEIVKPSLIEAQAGVMREVMLGKKKLADNRMDMYAQCVTYARGHSTPDKQAGRAAHIYKDIVGEWPPREWRFDETPNVTITANTLNKIRANNIRYVKGKAKSEGVPA